MAVGFRFHNGLLPAVAAVVVALLLVHALSWVFALIALTVADPETAQLAGFLPIFPVHDGVPAKIPRTKRHYAAC
jgi:hypothetical protein